MIWLLAIGSILVGIIALAAWSDWRDRRTDIDPSMRASALGDRRRQQRQRRTDLLTRKVGGQTPPKRSQDRPWER